MLHLKKKRTVLVIELRFGISADYHSLQEELAQLLLEVYYITRNGYVTQRGGSADYGSMLCVLGDHVTWHFFVVDVARFPYKVLYYVTIHDQFISLEKRCAFIKKKIEELY